MYSVSVTNSFKKNFKLCQKKNYDLSLFDEVLSLLIENGELTKKFKPHIL